MEGYPQIYDIIWPSEYGYILMVLDEMITVVLVIPICESLELGVFEVWNCGLKMSLCTAIISTFSPPVCYIDTSIGLHENLDLKLLYDGKNVSNMMSSLSPMTD